MTRAELADRLLEMAVDLGMLNALLASDEHALPHMIDARVGLLLAESALRDD